MSRSSKKGPYIDPKLLSKVLKQKESGKKAPIKTWSRACTVSPDFVGHTFMVHNGKVFNEVFVNEAMVGHKLGEFSPTRTFRGHGKVVKRTMTKT
jgi:small subunit ribosomal protein S19